MSKASELALKKRKALRQLKSLVKQTGKRDLEWYYDVGERVDLLCPSVEREYGQNLIQNLAKELGKKATYADTLWKTRVFRKVYTRSEVRSLCKPQGKSSFVITWSHMLALLSLDDKNRSRLQKECVKAEWSSRELHRRVTEFRKPQGKGGRRFRRPKDTETVLRQLFHESRTWDRRYNEAWFHADSPTIPQKVTKLAKEAVEVLEKIQSETEKCLELLKTPKKRRQRRKK